MLGCKQPNGDQLLASDQYTGRHMHFMMVEDGGLQVVGRRQAMNVLTHHQSETLMPATYLLREVASYTNNLHACAA